MTNTEDIKKNKDSIKETNTSLVDILARLTSLETKVEKLQRKWL